MAGLARALLVSLALLLASAAPACKTSTPSAATVANATAFPFGRALPGAQPFDPALVAKLEAAWVARPSSYQPHTRHLRPDGSPEYINRLFLEPSPYLEQHAHNPVSWYPWSDEAFETARTLGRPVLLSIGYSTCHWCHVMEAESFEDEEVARYLNENYVAIKVDREERPDLDAVYMSAVQMLSGGGGWPMTVWLTPDRRPFYAATYIPARDGERGVRSGFLTVLRTTKERYDSQPDHMAAGSEELTTAIRAQLSESDATAAGDWAPTDRVLADAERACEARFDPAMGGIKGAPKFPSSLPIRFLLGYQRRAKAPSEALAMATLTLSRMAQGGIHDQIGGGFHRYSTDAKWGVPHFEKMLYDNALLTMSYVEGYQATGRDDFAGVARDTLGYVGREMTSPEGAFYSATDADSMTPEIPHALVEGRFFTWTPSEVAQVVGSEDARVVDAFFDVTAAGNLDGRNVLHAPRGLGDVASALGVAKESVSTIVASARDRMYAARAQRPAPARDEKILASWNGLMIGAYARAALALGDREYADRAARAAEFVLARMTTKDGRLLRTFERTEAHLDAYLDDYAFLIAGLIDVYEATGDPQWIAKAKGLDATLAELFEDKDAGGFFLTSVDHQVLAVREKPGFDSAEPSGNSVETMNLLRLAELTSDDAYRKRAMHTLRAFGARLTDGPTALSEMMLAVDFVLDAPKEIVIVTSTSRTEAEPFLAMLRASFIPNRVLVVAAESSDLAAHAVLIPLLAGKTALSGDATAYVCTRGACELPTKDPLVFGQQIRQVSVRIQ